MAVFYSPFFLMRWMLAFRRLDEQLPVLSLSSQRLQMVQLLRYISQHKNIAAMKAFAIGLSETFAFLNRNYY